MPSARTVERSVVDTSVWVDFFRGKTPAVALIHDLARAHAAVICGQIVQETIQGARTETEVEFLRTQMALWHHEAEQPEDFHRAATLYARLRWKGVTVPPGDCLIAAVALRLELPLLSSDAHFAQIPGLKFRPVK